MTLHQLKTEAREELNQEFACICGGSRCGNVYREDIMDELGDFIDSIIDRTYHATKEDMRGIIIEVLKKNAGSPICDCSQALNEVRFALVDTTTSSTVS